MSRHAKALLFMLLANTAAAEVKPIETVACLLTHGGQTQLIEARATDAPYTVAPTEIGSYTLFRIVFRSEPADLASIKLYTYANHDDGRPIIQQATYDYPPVHGPRHGFTGLIRVYEPRYGGELEYWCELREKLSK